MRAGVFANYAVFRRPCIRHLSTPGLLQRSLDGLVFNNRIKTRRHLDCARALSARDSLDVRITLPSPTGAYVHTHIYTFVGPLHLHLLRKVYIYIYIRVCFVHARGNNLGVTSCNVLQTPPRVSSLRTSGVFDNTTNCARAAGGRDRAVCFTS